MVVTTKEDLKELNRLEAKIQELYLRGCNNEVINRKFIDLQKKVKGF